MASAADQVPPLPVAAVLPALLDSLAAVPNAVLVAPPGAGKTTLVPLALAGCLEGPGAAWLGGQRVVMLEPRRLAARAAAARMAALIGEAAGETVGYRTRDGSAVSARTRIEVVTEGILLRRLLSDPLLDGIGCVILDEVHERSLDADTALAFCLDLQRQLRPELRLLAMSATADAARLAERLGGPVIESAGRMFDVAIRHANRDLAGPRELPDAVARAVRHALGEHAEGDVLAFLPGVGEIRRAQAALEAMRTGALLLPLHGELPPGEQDRVLRPAPPGGRPRHVVLATSIAETSLTVPGVRVVVDGGWRRMPRLDPGSGLTRLEMVRVSRAAAAQRAGRAGREAPGTAYRLWTETAGRALALQDRPEIGDAELSGYRLQAACWAALMGTAPAALPMPDPPPAGAFEAAGALLRALGALDAAGAITAAGRRMAALGAHPRLAAMMLAARTPAEAALAADLAALLEERDPLRPRPVAGARAPDPPADIGARLELLREGGGEGADRAALARIRRAAEGYRRRLNVAASGSAPTAAPTAAVISAAPATSVGPAASVAPGAPIVSKASGGSAAVAPAASMGPAAAAVSATPAAAMGSAASVASTALTASVAPVASVVSATSEGSAVGPAAPVIPVGSGTPAAVAPVAPVALTASVTPGARVVPVAPAAPVASAAPGGSAVDDGAAGDPGALLAAGFPDRIAQRSGAAGAFRLSGGGGARLGRDDPLADARLLAVAALHVRDSARITLAAPLDPDRLPATLLDRTTEQVESGLDPASGAVVSRRRRRLGQLVLQDRTVAADPAETARLLMEAAAARLGTVLDWTDGARQLQARTALLRGLDGDGTDLPDLSDAALAATAGDWLLPALDGLVRLPELLGLDLAGLLRRRLGGAACRRLDAALPPALALGARRVAIDYTAPVPTASSRAQDFYGTTRLPVLADGRVRLQAALLSPAGRPAAITADLEGFWRGGWTEVRRDMRGRYPRHDWPEDPTASSAPQGAGQRAPVRPAR